MRAHVAFLGAVVALSACQATREVSRVDSAPIVDLAQSPGPGDTVRVVHLRPHYATIGRLATDADIRPWNIDANASGAGLPPGRGTYARGAQVFAAQCATCHGPNGQGIPPNPQLVGREPHDFAFAKDPKLPKTIGNYWPYATTLYDYINRAMPFSAPGSLSPGDVYSVVAFLLVENGIVDTSLTIDAAALPRVHMPAHDRFVLDDRRGGPVFR